MSRAPSSSCVYCNHSLTHSGYCPHCLLVMGLNGEGKMTSKSDELPTRFGDYEIVQEIARGGMGVVYLAEQKSLDRFVALKFLLHGKFTSDDLKERFRREARAAAALRHPNIVTVHEVGVVDEQPFLSMEFIEGRSLAEVLRDGPLPPDKAADYCRIVAQAIHYAHERWLLHRDLKPANVLIDLSGQPHITDFGLAGKMEIRSDLSISGQMLGTPAYFAPEQASGRAGEVTAAADIYSLGVIFYECLVGRTPFLADHLQDLLTRISDELPVSPRKLNPAIPRDLATICLKCLEKDPEQRYASAQEVADELGRWQRHEPIHARAAGPISHVFKWVRRHRQLTLLNAVCLTAAVLAIAFLIWQNTQLARMNAQLQQQLHATPAVKP